MRKFRKTEKKILKHYVKSVSKKGRRPRSLRRFGKKLGLTEGELYHLYTSFHQIESDVYLYFFYKTLKLMKKEGISEKTEMTLTFYYTYFEFLSNNRSYVKTIMDFKKPKLKYLNNMAAFKKEFGAFIIENDLMQCMELPEQLSKYRDQGIIEAAWSHFIFIFFFWLRDESPDFVKTDMLIEKSTNLSAELQNSSICNGIFDLGKFLAKEFIPKA